MNKINEAYDRIVNPEKYAARDRRAGGGRGLGLRARPATGYAGGAGGYGQGSQGSGQGQGYRQGGSGLRHAKAPTAGRAASASTSTTCSASAARAAAPASPSIPRRLLATAPGCAAPSTPSTPGAVPAGGGHPERRDQRRPRRALVLPQRSGQRRRRQHAHGAGADHARAVRMDPNNPDYQRAQRQFQQAGADLPAGRPGAGLQHGHHGPGNPLLRAMLRPDDLPHARALLLNSATRCVNTARAAAHGYDERNAQHGSDDRHRPGNHEQLRGHGGRQASPSSCPTRKASAPRPAWWRSRRKASAWWATIAVPPGGCEPRPHHRVRQAPHGQRLAR